MSEDYIIRPYQEGDEQGIVDLLKLTFPNWSSKSNAVDYWRWKYCSPPLGAIVSVAIHKDNIVSVTHDVFQRIKLGDTEYTCLYGDDAATHPDHQGKGVFRRLNNLNDSLQDNSRTIISYNVPTHPAFTKAPQKNEVYLPHNLTHYIKVVNPKAYVKNKNLKYSKFTEYGLGFTKGLGNLRATYNKRVSKDENLRIIEPKGFDDSLDSIWKEVSASLNFGVVRDSKYLEWRYGDPRAGRFLLREAFDSDTPVGFSVAEITGEGENTEGYIMEVLTNPRKLNVAYELTHELLLSLESLGVNTIHYRTMEEYPTNEVLSKLGFVTIPFQPKFLLKIIMKNVQSQF